MLLQSVAAADGSGPAEMLTTMTDSVSASIQSNPDPKVDPQRMGKIAERYIVPKIDFHTASRWVLGKYWRSASYQQRAAFVREFRELLVDTYLRSLSNYQDNKIRILSARPDQPNGRAVVDAVVDQPAGAPLKVVFRLHRKEGNWMIYDIVIEGVSLVATHRSGFANEIRRQGLDSLIAHLVLLNNSAATAAGVATQENP